MDNGITIQTPAESPVRINHDPEDDNFLVIVLLQEDTAKITKLERVHVFKNFKHMHKCMENYDCYAPSDNSMIIFRSGLEVFVAFVFWGRNHLVEQETDRRLIDGK